MPMKTTVSEINEILSTLPESALHQIRDFAFYLADRDRRRKELVKRVLKAEQEHNSIICNSVAEAMQAIYNTPDNDDEA